MEKEEKEEKEEGDGGGDDDDDDDDDDVDSLTGYGSCSEGTKTKRTDLRRANHAHGYDQSTSTIKTASTAYRKIGAVHTSCQVIKVPRNTSKSDGPTRWEVDATHKCNFATLGRPVILVHDKFP